MVRNLIQTGNSKALILTKDMRDHLGVEDLVDVEFRKGCLILRHPETPEPTDAELKASAKEAKPIKAEKEPMKGKEKAKDKEKEKEKPKAKSKGKDKKGKSPKA